MNVMLLVYNFYANNLMFFDIIMIYTEFIFRMTEIWRMLPEKINQFVEAFKRYVF